MGDTGKGGTLPLYCAATPETSVPTIDTLLTEMCLTGKLFQ